MLLTPDISGRTGWSRYALDLGKALHAEGHEVHCLVAIQEPATWCTQHKILRQPTTYLNAPFLRRIDAWRVSRLLQKIQPDMVHVLAEPYALLEPLMPAHPWKLCMTIHGTYSVLPLTHGNATKELFEKAYHDCDAIVSVSQFTKNYLASRAPELFQSANLDKKIAVIPNAVDLTRFSSIHKKSSAQKRIISVSGVKPKKGYRAAIEGVAQFLKSHPIDLQYDIFGYTTMDPAFVTSLQTRIAELGLQKIITFRGSVDDATLEAAYAEADVFLLPSLHEGDHFEGFGLVFLEANAHGVPVIGSTTGGCPEAIQEGISGYTCEPDNSDAIATRLEDILVKNLITPEACIKWAAEHDIVKAAAAISNIYQTLIKV